MSWGNIKPVEAFTLAGETPSRIQHLFVPVAFTGPEGNGVPLYEQPNLLDLDANTAKSALFDLVMVDMRAKRYSVTDEGIIRNPKTLTRDLSKSYSGGPSADARQQHVDRLKGLVAHISGAALEDLSSTIHAMDPDDYAEFLLKLQREAYHPTDGGSPLADARQLWQENPLGILFSKPQLLSSEQDFKGVTFGGANFLFYPHYTSTLRGQAPPEPVDEGTAGVVASWTALEA